MGWLSGWTYQKARIIGSSSISLTGDLTNFSIDFPVDSSHTNFWNHVKTDGSDVRFTSSDGTTVLTKVTVSFNYAGQAAVYKILIPTLTYLSDPTIYIYAGNPGATSDDNASGCIDSSFVSYWLFDSGYSGGAFVDLKGTNNGTDHSTTDVAGTIGRGRGVTNVTSAKNVSFADNNSLSFGNGTADSPFSVAVVCKPGDMTRLRLFSKHTSTTVGEYILYFSASDFLGVILRDNSASASIGRLGTSAHTADEGAEHAYGFTYDGSSVDTGIIQYRDDAVDASSSSNSGTYVAMENGTGLAYAGSYTGGTEATGSGDIFEVALSSVVRSLDWYKAYNASRLGTWLTWGSEVVLDHPVVTDSGTGSDAVSVSMSSSTVSITDSATGIDEVLGITVNFAIDETATGTDSILAYNGQLVGVTDVGTVTDIVNSIIANFILSESASGGDSVSVSGGSVSGIILESTPIWPSGQVVEYQIVDEYEVVIQAWSSTGIVEIPLNASYSVYRAKIGLLSQYTIMFRILALGRLATRTVDRFETNTASILTIVTFLNKYVRNKKEIKRVAGVNRLYIYDNDGTTLIIDKTLKDSAGNDITALVAGVMAIEGASSV